MSVWFGCNAWTEKFNGVRGVGGGEALGDVGLDLNL